MTDKTDIYDAPRIRVAETWLAAVLVCIVSNDIPCVVASVAGPQ